MLFWNRNKPKQAPPRPQRFLGGVVDLFQRLFNASKADRTALNWKTNLEHIDSVIQYELRTLVTRSRHAYSNHSVIRKFIKMRVRHVVGSHGIQLQVYAQNDELNNATEKAFAQWARRCDVTDKLNFKQLQASVIRAVDLDGECFVVMHEIDGTLKLQLIDGQRVPSGLMATKQNGNRIVNGIEVDGYGKPLAYYVTTEDTPLKAYTNYGSEKDYLRLDAQDVLHLFVPEFIGQKRGIPATATALVSLYHLERYTFATLLNSRHSANKGLYLKSEFIPEPEPVDSFDKDGNKIKGTPAQETIQMSQEGEIMVLPDGYTPVTHNPTFPSGEFAQFKKEILKDASSGLDVSYSSLASDGEGTNYSTMRHFTLDERDEYMMVQEDLIADLCVPIYEKWLKLALIKGDIKLNSRSATTLRQIEEDLLNHQWQGRRWSWVDPLKDSSATIQNIRSLTKSFSQTIREQGRDPKELYAEIARDIKEMQAKGIPQPIIEAFFQTSLDESSTEGNEDELSESVARKEKH